MHSLAEWSNGWSSARSVMELAHLIAATLAGYVRRGRLIVSLSVLRSSPRLARDAREMLPDRTCMRCRSCLLAGCDVGGAHFVDAGGQMQARDVADLVVRLGNRAAIAHIWQVSWLLPLYVSYHDEPLSSPRPCRCNQACGRMGRDLVVSFSCAAP